MCVYVKLISDWILSHNKYILYQIIYIVGVVVVNYEKKTFSSFSPEISIQHCNTMNATFYLCCRL